LEFQIIRALEVPSQLTASLLTYTLGSQITCGASAGAANGSVAISTTAAAPSNASSGGVELASGRSKVDIDILNSKYSTPSFSKSREPEGPASEILLYEIVHRQYLAR